MKLWSKNYHFDALVEHFTVGDDNLLDQELIPYDCIASLAHATMLESIGVVSIEELRKLREGLQAVMYCYEKDEFTVDVQQEDCHTAIENFLVLHYGEVGKKIHTARSRNDQVLVAVRLYEKEQLLTLISASMSLADTCMQFAKTHEDVPIPGRTHMQLAMPSSLGLWAAAIAESLLDDIDGIRASFAMIDQCPLGSASSYGVLLPIDREMTANLLGFSRVLNNVLYANNSRVKFEANIIHAIGQLMLSLSKAASDIMFFALPEIGYVSLPDELCSGSSLMPNKKNPCALELIRARAATVISYLHRVLDIARPLPSGYHRDFQESKEPVVKSFAVALRAVAVLEKHVSKLLVHHNKCVAAFHNSELFATDMTLREVQNGVPFRDAYQRVASRLENIPLEDPQENIKCKTHRGAPGNLGFALFHDRKKEQQEFLIKQRHKWSQVKMWFVEK